MLKIPKSFIKEHKKWYNDFKKEIYMDMDNYGLFPYYDDPLPEDKVTVKAVSVDYERMMFVYFFSPSGDYGLEGDYSNDDMVAINAYNGKPMHIDKARDLWNHLKKNGFREVTSD